MTALGRGRRAGRDGPAPASGRRVDVLERAPGRDRGRRGRRSTPSTWSPPTRPAARPTRSTPRVAAGEDPGPLAGVPVALKDNLCTRGVPTTCSSRILEGWRPPYDATVVTRLAAAGAVVRRQDQHGRVRHGLARPRTRPSGRPATPTTPARVPGGSSRRVGRRGGRRLRPARPRLGHRRLDPPAGRPLRRGRDEADLRHRLPLRAGRLRQLARPDRPVRHHGGRRRPALRRHRRPRPARLDLARPARPRGCARSSTTGVDGLRVGRADRAPRRRARPTWWPGCARRPRRWPPPAPRSRRSRSPRSPYGLSAYYLIAPAEASSNLARYDGVRYGLRVDGDDTAAMNTATRRPGFGAEVKRRIMLGTYVLSAGYYDAYYDQAQRVRTLIIEGFDRRLRAASTCCSAPTAPTTAFALGAKVGRPADHVPVRRVHHPVQPGRATRRSACPSAPGTTACRSACRCWRRRWPRAPCSGWPPWSRRRPRLRARHRDGVAA